MKWSNLSRSNPVHQQNSDILILPTIEEGSALVTSEARGCGCVLLVSEAAGAICTHMENALIHPVGDVETLSNHISMLHDNKILLESFRTESIRTAQDITWSSAGIRLLKIYNNVILESKT